MIFGYSNDFSFSKKIRRFPQSLQILMTFFTPMQEELSLSFSPKSCPGTQQSWDVVEGLNLVLLDKFLANPDNCSSIWMRGAVLRCLTTTVILVTLWGCV